MAMLGDHIKEAFVKSQGREPTEDEMTIMMARLSGVGLEEEQESQEEAAPQRPAAIPEESVYAEEEV